MKRLAFLFAFTLLLVQTSEAAVTLSILEPDHNFFSGEKIERTVLLESDFPQPSGAVLRWETLVRPAIIERSQKKINLKPGRKSQIKINLAMPEVKRRARLTWRIQLVVNGKKLLERELQYSVFPKDIPANVKNILSGKKLGLFDPQGKTGEILRNLRIEFQELRTQLSLEAFQGDLVLIGSAVPDKELANTLLALEGKVKEGLSILCLEQSKSIINLFLLPAETISVWPSPVSSSKISAFNHPVFREMEENDLSNWSGDGIISRWPYQIPAKGNFRILTRARTPDLATAFLIEIPYGQGKFIFCQMLITEKFNEEPAARLLFENLISHALMKTKALEPAAIFGDPESEMMKVLDSLKVAGPRNPAQVNEFNLAIICADERAIELIRKRDPTWRSHLKEFIQKGGTLLIFNLNFPTLDIFREVIPTELSLIECVLGEVTFERESPLLWRITENDLEMLLFRKSYHHLVFDKGEDAKMLIGLGSLAKFRQGKGSIIVSQVPFQEDDKISLHILSQLLTNLGVEIISERW